MRLTGHLNLGFKFALMFTALALMALTEFGALVGRLVSYRAEAKVSQMVGHQHMLVYRIATQAAEIALPGSAGPRAIDELRSSADDFDQALAALLDGNPSRDLPALSNAEERFAAERVRASWLPFRAAVDTLIAHEGDPEGRAQAVAISFIFKNQGELMGAVYDLVDLLRVHADQKANSVWQFGLLMGGVYIMAILTGWVAVERGISLPLRRLASAAESVARGDVRAGTGLPMIRTHDEIGRLTRAFNNMFDELQKQFAANAQTYAELERRARQLQTLHAVSRMLVGTLDLDVVLQRLAGSACQLIGARHSTLAAFDQDGTLTHFVSDSLVPEGEPDGVQQSARRELPSVLLVEGHTLRLDKLLAAPITVRGKAVGNIYVTEKENGQPFTAEDEEQLNALAADAALALENARLFEQVVRSQKEWETTFDAIAEGVALYDSQFTIVRVNRALGRLLGTTSQDLAGQNVHQALCGCQSAECEILIAQRSERVESIEFPDAGRRRRFQMFHCPIEGPDGHPVSAVLVLRDVTQERIWQMRMLQTEKLASLGQLAAGVAHEINNPLGYINSNLNSLASYATELRQVLTSYRGALTEMAEQQRGRGAEVLSGAKEQGQGSKGSRGNNIPSARLLSREAEHNIDFLLQDFAQAVVESQEGVERVQGIVSSLKHFARVDESYEMKYVDLHEGLESMLKIVWNELKYKAMVERDYGQLPPVRCHLPRLNQVFMNLLVNAAQAIEKDGKITIRTWAEEDWVTVAITDNGCGIPAANIPRLFEPFFTTKEIGQSTGLGLSVAYGIVQEHNGRIEVESTVGQGSTFTVILPVHGP